MKANTISLRRRHLIAAAAAVTATPAGAFTFLGGGAAVPAAVLPQQGEKLIVSGRIVDPAGKPVADATVEAWHSDVHRTTVKTDGDGRLMFTTTTPGERDALSYRVTGANSGAREGRFQMFRAASGADSSLVHLHRDDAGVWRSTFGLTLA